MSVSEWGMLTPERVSQWINFNRDDLEWTYRADAPASMQKCQAEGVAALWNTLGRDKLALLADEVGMGKTLQALGVLALLWKQNPEAQVLVMAPNRDICAHWAREYHAFLRDHYREVDHLVRNGADGGPVHTPQLCWRLSDLVDTVKAGASQFYLTTIYSLSGLVPREEKDSGNVLGKAERAANRIHKTLKTELGEGGFDLIIVDEAHYFRNAHGGSQRAHVARRFFGDENSRLGQKVLLMTATPSHTSLNDIPNIFGFFKAWEAGQEPTPSELLENHAVRRLRLMQGANTHHNKYHYRHEIALPSSFDDNPEAEMFFALYQKKLVQQQERSGSGKRYLYGYLEGFESVGVIDADEQIEDETNSDAGSSTSSKPEDFRSSDDSSILSDLTRLHFEHFSRYPEHPKYNTLVKLCTPVDVFNSNIDLHEHKHLVFVRRIPSVREITQRVNAEYDALLAKRIVQAWNPQNPEQVLAAWQAAGWSRRFYNRFVTQQATNVAGDEEFSDWQMDTGEDVEQEKDEKLTSRIANLFVVKKTGAQRSTDASNASLRFRKPESLFSLFMEPASDYKNGCYTYYFRKRSGERNRDDYGDAALTCRLKVHGGYAAKSESEGSLETQEQRFVEPLTTAWGMMFDMLADVHRQQIERWIGRDAGIVENFANYVKSGFLFASPVMVELYSWLLEFTRQDDSTDAQVRYLAFCRWVASRLPGSLMYLYFCAAIETFEQLCEKISDHGLADWQKQWRVLTGLQNPAWYASGESSHRQRLILGFNSPFYPNVLVATSVFQEGVNLHLQCRKVHHYGIAWTPGDNEQRVGRVDRLFGRVNQQLLQHGQGELAIHYPYLARSFDQDQLASFISLKHGVEARMDACSQADFNEEIDIKRVSTDWKRYLRKPDHQASATDPFPARFDRANVTKFYEPMAFDDGFYLHRNVHELLAGAIDQRRDTIQSIAENEFHPGVMSLIETEINRDGSVRKQPVVASVDFDAELSALVSGTVYILRLESPLASLATLEREGLVDVEALGGLVNQLKAWPLVRMALDDDRANSHFYLHLRVDLPVFVIKGGISHLSTYEVQVALNQLKEAADSLEWSLFSERQDLKKEDLKVFRHTVVGDHGTVVRSKTKGNGVDGWGIEESSSGHIAVTRSRFSQKAIPGRLSQRVEAKWGLDTMAGILRLNAKLPMIAANLTTRGIEVRVAYPADDFQIEEQELLMCWMSYILEKGC